MATVPPALIHLAGRVVGPVNALLGTRLFPFDAAMARLTTRKLFYSSEKARADLGYEPTPFRDLVPAVMEWYDAAQRAGGRADPRVARRRSGATVAQGQRAATVAARSNAPVETSAVDTSSVEAEAPHGETPVVTAAHDDPVDQTEPVV